MNAAELMTDLTRLGIRLEARGDRLRYSPRSAVTPDLAQRMKVHKRELLAILCPEGPNAEPLASVLDWEERAEPDGRVSLIHPDHAGNDLEAIAPPEPCPKCGSLQLWWNFLGNSRCMKCDPPCRSVDTP